MYSKVRQNTHLIAISPANNFVNLFLTFIMKVYGMAAWTNPLHPDAFPGLSQMEMEVVRMVCDMFQVQQCH